MRRMGTCARNLRKNCYGRSCGSQRITKMMDPFLSEYKIWHLGHPSSFASPSTPIKMDGRPSPPYSFDMVQAYLQMGWQGISKGIKRLYLNFQLPGSHLTSYVRSFSLCWTYTSTAGHDTFLLVLLSWCPEKLSMRGSEASAWCAPVS
jgi:hypothetical protein